MSFEGGASLQSSEKRQKIWLAHNVKNRHVSQPQKNSIDLGLAKKTNLQLACILTVVLTKADGKLIT